MGNSRCRRQCRARWNRGCGGRGGRGGRLNLPALQCCEVFGHRGHCALLRGAAVAAFPVRQLFFAILPRSHVLARPAHKRPVAMRDTRGADMVVQILVEIRVAGAAEFLRGCGRRLCNLTLFGCGSRRQKVRIVSHDVRVIVRARKKASAEWLRGKDLNLRPPDYESGVLTGLNYPAVKKGAAQGHLPTQPVPRMSARMPS